jgi:hypothetical protein
MRVLRNDPDRYSFERVNISEIHPRSNIRPTASFMLDGSADAAPRKQRQADVVLKCLHRDDPMRHTYLRRRWRAT